MNALGQQATRHKNLITWVLGAALTVTALAVSGAYWVATRHKEKPVLLPQSVPIDIHQQLSGYTVTHSDGDRRVYTVHAARTVSFKQGGTTVLEDVLVELFGRTGKQHDIMRTQRCDYNGQNGDLFTSGPVHIELNTEADKTQPGGVKGRQTVYLETSRVSYRHEGSQVVSDQAVNFRIGPASGTSQGMVYATKEGSLELEKDVVMKLSSPDGQTSNPPLRLTARRLRYERRSKEITLMGPIQVTQGERNVSGGSGKVFLNEADRVTQVDLEGGVKASESSADRVVEISADHAQGDFDPVSRTLRHLTAQGNVAGQLQEKESASRLLAERVELNLVGIPARLQNGDATENVQLLIESSPSLGRTA